MTTTKCVLSVSGLFLLVLLAASPTARAFDTDISAQTNTIAIAPQFPGGEPYWIYGISAIGCRYYVVENTAHWYPGSPLYEQVYAYISNAQTIQGVPVSSDLQLQTLAEGDTLDVTYVQGSDCVPHGQIAWFFADTGNQDNSGHYRIRCEPIYSGNYDGFPTLDLGKWGLLGSPDPVIAAGDGLPAPCLEGMGDNNYSEGLYSLSAWDADGLFVEAAMKNDAIEAVPGARCGLWMVEYHDLWDNEEAPFDGYWAAAVHLNPWDSSTTWLGIWDGTQRLESFEFEPDDQWHHWRIEVNPDRTVTFYRDHQVFYETTQQLPPEVSAYQTCLITGSRSFHDEVTVCGTAFSNVPMPEMVQHDGISLTAQPSVSINGDVTIRYELISTAGSGLARILDSEGRLVRGLMLRNLEPGAHGLRWDRRTDLGTRAPAGVYFADLVVDGRSQRQTRFVIVD